MFLVVFGTIVRSAGTRPFDLGLRTSTVHLIAGVALATVLFSDAAGVPRPHS